MATGDRSFIADKDTLDAVKQSTDELKQSTSSILTNTEQAKSSLSNLESKLGSTQKGSSIDNDRRSKLIYGIKVSGAGTWVDVVNITGQSGQLYFVLATCQPSGVESVNNTTTVIITVDGINIYNGVITMGTSGGTTNIGFATKPAIVGVQGNNALTLISGHIIGMGSNLVPHSSNNGNMPTVLASEPIRFNNSLQIRAQGNRVAATVYYYYETD